MDFLFEKEKNKKHQKNRTPLVSKYHYLLEALTDSSPRCNSIARFSAIKVSVLDHNGTIALQVCPVQMRMKS